MAETKISQKVIAGKEKQIIGKELVKNLAEVKPAEMGIPDIPALARWTGLPSDLIKKILSDVELLTAYKTKKKVGLDAVMIAKAESIVTSISSKDIKAAKLRDKVISLGILMDKVFPKETPIMAQQINVDGAKSIKVTYPNWGKNREEIKGEALDEREP